MESCLSQEISDGSLERNWWIPNHCNLLHRPLPREGLLCPLALRNNNNNEPLHIIIIIIIVAVVVVVVLSNCWVRME